jgi:YegS/Rv2252/BmrU family lipid kinase
MYVVLNPIAGHSTADDIRQWVEENFSGAGMTCEIYETTGEEDVAEITRSACQNGSRLVVAAGGDGTVAAVINGLLGTGIPLGVIPAGTGNGLARALGIPLDIPQAIELIAADHRTIGLDALKVGDQYYVLNVSAGLSARTMDETPVENKRRFGMLAYVWTFIKQMFGVQPRRFWLTVDGHRLMIRASEILISNGALLKEPLPLGPPEFFNDGQMDIYIVTARTLRDYLRIAWNVLIHKGRKKSDLRHLTARQKVIIEAYRGALPTQADGEPLGLTPIEIDMIPDALKVIVPLEAKDEASIPEE